MKIGIAQINTTVGDLAGNQTLILDAYNQLVKEGAELVLFPELAICGYPPRDLLLKSRFSDDAEATLKTIASKIESVPALIGTLEVRPKDASGRPLYNALAWCEQRAIQTFGRKCLLPNYDVFDEERYFEPAQAPNIYKWKGLKIGLSICEDLWNPERIANNQAYKTDPIETFEREGIDILINLSASPWHCHKEATRTHLIESVSKRLKCPVIYCNSVGGNDELVFDGASFATDKNGTLIDSLPSFQSALKVIDLADTRKLPKPSNQEPQSVLESEVSVGKIKDALVLGLRDYAQKSHFQKALIGLSGGIDSAVVAAIATQALGKENIIGIAMPSEISSAHSLSDAEALAKNLGIAFQTLPIKETYKTVESSLKESFKNYQRDVTEENIQARIRGLFLMALSNKYGALLLTTGNKSEIAVGYCTLYGDMCGGLAVISDVPKMQVYALARFLNKDGVCIPENTIEKAPSAELSPDQKDQDSLPPYPELDAILNHYIEDGRSRAEIIARGFDSQIVNSIVKKVDQNEYKRKQAAPGLKISPLAFGVGRRMPIVQKYTN